MHNMSGKLLRDSLLGPFLYCNLNEFVAGSCFVFVITLWQMGTNNNTYRYDHNYIMYIIVGYIYE
jgi:hypothetical protein